MKRRLRGTGEAIEETNRVTRPLALAGSQGGLALSESSNRAQDRRALPGAGVGQGLGLHREPPRKTLARRVAYYGRPPQMAEFEWRRQCGLELAGSQGDDTLHLPSPTPTAGAGIAGSTLDGVGYSPE